MVYVADKIVMAFLPTARSASIYNEIFANMQLPYPTWEIHSRMSQSARGKATEAFRAAKEGVLFSSDVTARGIDVKGVTAVIQVGLPSNEEQCMSHFDLIENSADLQTSIDWVELPEREKKAMVSSSWAALRNHSFDYPSSELFLSK